MSGALCVLSVPSAQHSGRGPSREMWRTQEAFVLPGTMEGSVSADTEERARGQ